MSGLIKRDLSSYEEQYIIENEIERFQLFYSMLPYRKELEFYIETRDAAQRRTDQAMIVACKSTKEDSLTG